MDDIQILIWVMGLGFTAIGTLTLYLNNNLSNKIDSLDSKLTNRIDKLDEKLTDVDRRLCRLEGAFSRQECCVIHSKNQERISM